MNLWVQNFVSILIFLKAMECFHDFPKKLQSIQSKVKSHFWSFRKGHVWSLMVKMQSLLKMLLTFAIRRFISYFEIAIQLFIKTIILTIQKNINSKFRASVHKGKIHLTFLWHILQERIWLSTKKQLSLKISLKTWQNKTKQNKTF